MTGFGGASGSAGPFRISIEIRSVNHRFFNPNVKVPSILSSFEGDLRERMRQRIARGHVTLNIQVERDKDTTAAIDDERFAAYLEHLRRLSRKHQIGDISASDVLRLPGVVASTTEEEGTPTRDELLAILDTAINAFDAMRTAEGKRMAEYLAARLTVFTQALERVEVRAPNRLKEQHLRLKQSVAELTRGLGIDEQRLAQEIALLADKMDIAEEIGRLRSHIGAFESTLTGSASEPVGKRLGFILQEMLREVNTIGSKGADAEILRDVVLMKEELERVREQAENVE